uniref:Uncharacterized protein n=1 Tax=viral metagenome TaxID=1070528 RepID=A0A6C0E3E0_9ZZZZ
MVYMSGSTRARHTSSITNLPTCGGDKKGGLAPTGTSFFLSSNPNSIGTTNTQFGLICCGNYSTPAQSTVRRVMRGLL